MIATAQFNRFSAISASFYSREVYRDVATRWTGTGLLYLLLLLALSWLPSAIRWSLGLRHFAVTESQAVVRQLPTVTVKDGIMTAQPSGRHVIALEPEKGSAGDVLVIDDTADTIPVEAGADTFAVARTEAGMIPPGRGERRVWPFGQALNLEVTPEDVNGFVRGLAFVVPPIGYVSALAGSFVFRLLQTLLYGAATRAYARQQGVTLDYAAAVRLAVVAITPVVVIRTLIWFGAWEPAWYVRWPVALLITLGYLRFAILAVAEGTKPDGQLDRS